MNSELVSRLNHSDHAAFTEIYNLMSGRVYGAVMYVLNDATIARDVVQDLFLTLWERRATLDPDGNLEAYIAVMARNLAYKYFDQALSKTFPAVNMSVAEGIESDDDSAAVAESDSLESQLMKIIRSQPEMRRKVFMMSRFENLSYSEIAERLNISERTVESHIYQVVKVLKEKMSYYMIALVIGDVFL